MSNSNQTGQPQEAVMKVKKDYLSVSDLEPMDVGQKVMFVLPPEKLQSAKQTCANMKYKCRQYSASPYIDMDGGESYITVTRIR